MWLFGESRSGLGEFLCSLFHFYLFETSIFVVVVPCFNSNSSIFFSCFTDFCKIEAF